MSPHPTIPEHLDFRYQDLQRPAFERETLEGARFTGANLYGVNLSFEHLLEYRNLEGCVFRGANLTGARLQGRCWHMCGVKVLSLGWRQPGRRRPAESHIEGGPGRTRGAVRGRPGSCRCDRGGPGQRQVEWVCYGICTDGLRLVGWCGLRERGPEWSHRHVRDLGGG